jgi:hypothetical protein
LLVVVVLSEGEVSVLVLVGLGAGAGGALIFTIQGWQKNNWKKIKISLPLYFPQVLFALLVLLWNWNFFTVSDFLPFILFVLLAGGPAILCVIALARKKKKRT